MKKKQIASLILAAAISASLAVPAMAADPNTTWDGSNFASGTKSSFDVGSSSSATKSNDIVYYVTVDWTMTPANDGETTIYDWNPETLQYSKSTAGSSTTKTNAEIDITVTNYSNAPIRFQIKTLRAKDSNGNYMADSTAYIDDEERYAIYQDYIRKTNSSDDYTYLLASAADSVKNITATDDTGKGTATSGGYAADYKYLSGYNVANCPIMATTTVYLYKA